MRASASKEKVVPMDAERRKAPRINKSLTVKYSQPSQSPIWDFAIAKNISRKGIFLNTRKNFAKGEILKLLIKVPADPFHWMEVEGKVIESIGNTARLNFIGIAQEQEKMIGDYVEWLIKYSLSKKH